MEGQSNSEFLIRLWAASSKGRGILSAVASAGADIPLQTPGMQLAPPDKSWAVEQQGGLADNELCPRIPGTAGIQISWEVIGELGCARADNTRKARREMHSRFLEWLVPEKLLCCHSLGRHWGEKSLIFVVKKRREILFFQRGRMCLNWGKKKVFLCVCFPAFLLYLYIKREN